MNSEVLVIPANDGYLLNIKINYPNLSAVDKLIIFVNASGPFTYNTKRKTHNGKFFNYFDIFANESINRGYAFCSYSTRGVKDGETPPFFAEINDKEYETYIPQNSILDVIDIISYLKMQSRFINSKVILLGWSEGTIIAPLIALNNNIHVDALLLAGYCNSNLWDILEWQLSGNAILVNWNRLFDYDKKGFFTKNDFELDKYNVRKGIFGDTEFEEIDLNKDGIIDINDTAPLCIEHKNNMFKAIENNDDEWLKNNHGIRLTSAWFHGHKMLEPNSKVLPLLDIPIHIFHGENDASCPVQFAYDIKNTFDEMKKNNLFIHTFANHDHDLNYMTYIYNDFLSEGISKIFKVTDDL